MAFDKKRNFGEIELNGELLMFQVGKGRKQMIDLNQEYQAKISADESATQLNIYSKDYKTSFSVFVSGINRNEVLKLYPAEYFLNEIAISLEGGMFGFDLDSRNREIMNLVTDLFLTLWKTRGKNTLFSLYQKFP
ncbi:MAG: hypothetical protein ACP5P3_10730 [Ignavibacteria bacterium]